MRCVLKLLALAMVAEGMTLCLARKPYLQMWRNLFGGAKHWIDWFDEHSALTQKLAVWEIGFGVVLLKKLLRAR